MATTAGDVHGLEGGPSLRATLYREGEFWTITAAATTLRLPDGKGLRHLADIASTPERPWHALDLARSAAGGDEPGRAAPAPGTPPGAPPDADHIPASARELRARLRELDEELEEAEAFHDVERASRVRAELQQLEQEVAELLDAATPEPPAADAGANAERARVNVTRALKATIKRIAAREPQLGRLLELSIQTGSSCVFRPPPGFALVVGRDAAPPATATPAPPPAAPSTARAPRTLVAIELADAADLAARVGETRWTELLARHDAAVRAQAGFFGGRAAQRTGDRTLVAFDGAGAAVRCAAAVIASGRDAGMLVRAGVHHGDCEVLGDSVTGLAVHAADRLAALADPGQLVVSEDVRRLLDGSGVPLADRGVHELRGVPGTWRVHQALLPELAPAPGAAAHPAAAPAATATPPLPPRLTQLAERRLVGRDVELDLLATAVATAAQGSHAVVAVGGEPGIGKTRLITEAAIRAHTTGATVLHGRCDEDLAIPYQPIVAALGHLVDTTPEAARGLDGTGALARLLPQLAHAAPPRATAPSTPDDGERYVLFSQIAQLLAGAPGLVVLVVDDVQWADRETLLLLKYLVRAPAPARLALLLTYRSTDLADDHPLSDLLGSLRADETFTQIDLQGLGQAEILALTAELAGTELPAPLLELSRALAGETRGNAFFTTEILRHLADSGDLARAADEWRTSGARAVPRLPGTVRETITHRIGRLGDETEDLLTVAATIGGDFDLGLLAQASGRDEDDVLDLLDGAVAAGIVTLPDEDGRRYAFAHGLVADTLYDALPPGRRRRIHRQVALALEERLGPDPRERVSELAHHVLRGAYSEDLGRALRYARLAGDHALAQLAPHEAERWYERALGVADQQPTPDGERCDLLIALGTAQNQAGTGYRETLLDAADLAIRLDDADRLVRAVLANTRGFVSATGTIDLDRVARLEHALAAAPEDDPRRAQLLATMAAELTFSGDWERRVALADEAVALARAKDDPVALAAVLGSRFMTTWTPETLDRRDADSAEQLALAERHGDLPTRFGALHWRATVCVERGEMQEAARLVEREAALARQIGQPIPLWLAAYDRATQALTRGLLDEADSWAQEAGRIAMESGQPEAVAFLTGQVLNIAFERGTLGALEPLIAAQVAGNPGIPAFEGALALARVEAGLDDGAREVLARQAADGFAGFPYDSNWLVGLVIFAEACGRAGGAAAAAALYERLLPAAGQVAFNSATVWGLVDRPLGNLAAVLGRREEAEARLRDALVQHERMGAPLWLARTRVDLATLLGPEDDEARTLAAEARATAEDLGAQGIAARAAAIAGASA